jgi:hypothetical protein
MIKLEKNKFLKINEYCYLSYTNRWGSENEFFYFVSIICDGNLNSMWGQSIFGYGETAEEALIMAMDNLVKKSLKSIPISYAKDHTLCEIIDYINKNEGGIERPDTLIVIDKTNSEYWDYADDQDFSITIDGDNAWPLVE